MKSILKISAIFAIASLAACSGQVKDVEVGPYTITTIDKNIYHIQDYNSSYPAGEIFDEEGNMTHSNNCSDMYLVVGKNKALLIDLSNKIRWADNAEESIRQIVAERIGDKELTITFTHNHGDHTGMLSAFSEDRSVRYALPEGDFKAMAARFPDAQSNFIEEGYVFDLGGIEVEAVTVPGHTNGSTVFYVHGRDLLFTGDAIGSGHGVWIFNEDGFRKYVSAVPHLIAWLENPDNNVNTGKLRIYGGHYWQKSRLTELKDRELGMPYLYDMQQVVNEIEDGTAASEPSGLTHRVLDTYFIHGTAIVVWNAEQAREYVSGK